MPEVSEDMFTDAVRQVVKDNLSFLPPYGTGGALYIRFGEVEIFTANQFTTIAAYSFKLLDLSYMALGLASACSHPMSTPW